jgi:hypothetical protein
LKFEIDFLLVPLHVPHHLLDVRDDIPGYNFWQNSSCHGEQELLDFYLHILKGEFLQQGLKFKPVPAVIHYWPRPTKYLSMAAKA